MKFCGINSYLESHANILQKLSINILLSFHLQDKNHTYCYFCLTALTKSKISEHSSSKKDAIIFLTYFCKNFITLQHKHLINVIKKKSEVIKNNLVSHFDSLVHFCRHKTWINISIIDQEQWVLFRGIFPNGSSVYLNTMPILFMKITERQYTM